MTMEIDTDFEGGNLHVLKIDGDVIHVVPELRDTEGHWFYWCFRVRGAQGRRLRFVFADKPSVGALGPAVSRDGGRTWSWLTQQGDAPDDAFELEMGMHPEVRLSMCIPYVPSDWVRFTANLPARAQPGVLCASGATHKVPCLRVLADPAEPTQGMPSVVLTARHHACETTASYVLEGMVGAWSGMHHVPELLVVPFVDFDGALRGDQGKNRRPHDHNRDYREGIYPEVRALREVLASIQSPWVAFDLHCPYLRYGINERFYQVGSSTPRFCPLQAQFAQILQQQAQSFPYDPADDVPYGTDWNQAANYANYLSSVRWMALQDHCQFATTLEIPYANVAGVAVTTTAARRFGASLAKAVALFIRKRPMKQG